MSNSFESEVNQEISYGKTFSDFVKAHCIQVNPDGSPYHEHMSGRYSLHIPENITPVDEVRFRVNTYGQGIEELDEDVNFDCFAVRILSDGEVVYSIDFLEATSSVEERWFVSLGELGDHDIIRDTDELVDLAKKLIDDLTDLELEGSMALDV